MKRYVGVVFLVVGLLCSACGAPRCSTTNCDGCCDANGMCQQGAMADACGSGGLTCQACLVGSSCVNAQCLFLGGSGGGSATGGGSASGGGGGTSTGGGGGAASGGGSGAFTGIQAHVVALRSVTVPASCYRAGVAPTNSTLPARTVEVLTWETSGEGYIALDELGTLRAGDAPAVVSPRVAMGSPGRYAWSRATTTPVGEFYTELRQVQMELQFDPSGATGRLQVSAQYACVAGRSACPTGAAAPQDAASCSLTIPFDARRVLVTAKWTTPSGAPVTGARKVLVAMDFMPLRTIAVPSCFRNNNLPPGRTTVSENGTRERFVFQQYAIGPNDLLRTGTLSFKLGDSPEISVTNDVSADGGVYVQRTMTQSGTDFTETRTTSFALAGLPSGAATLDLGASWTCTNGSFACPAGDQVPIDAASCSVRLTGTGALLP